MKYLLITFILIGASPCIAQIDSLNSYYTKGISAVESGDSVNYFHYFDMANNIRPNHPTILYHLANAALQLKDNESCLAALTNMVKNNVAVDFDKEGFTQFKEIEEFHNLGKLKTYLTSEVNRTKEIVRSQIPDHVESIAYNTKTKTHYFGAVNSRSIWMRDSKGNENVIIKQTENDSIYAVMGLAVDQKKQLLWACTAALPQMTGYTKNHEGHSSVLKIDLKSNTISESYQFSYGNTFGDIKLKNGIPYVSDGSDNNIYYLKEGEFKKLLPEDNGFINLQGIDFDGNVIYASDYIRGLFRIEAGENIKIEKLNVFGEYPEKGIDGVYFSNGYLYMTQNGANPMRVFQLNLSDQSDLELLIQNSDLLNEPTQGTIIDGKFYFIANSAWANYSKENVFNGNKEGVLLLGN